MCFRLVSAEVFASSSHNRKTDTLLDCIIILVWWNVERGATVCIYGCASVMKFQIEKEICCAIAMNTNARLFSPHVACVNASTVWMVLVFNQLFMTSIARCRMHILRVQKDRNFIFFLPHSKFRGRNFFFLNLTLEFVIHIIYASQYMLWQWRRNSYAHIILPLSLITINNRFWASDDSIMLFTF